MKQVPFKLLGLLLACILWSVAMQAQPTTDRERDSMVSSVKQMLTEWNQSYITLPQHRNVNRVIQFYTDDYVANRTSYKITGQIENDKGNIYSLRSLLERINTLQAPKTTYNIKDIYKIGVHRNIAYVVMNADFMLEDGNNLVAKGSEVQTIVLRNEGGKWKIAQADILNLVDEQKRDVCGCTIFVAGKNEFIAKVQHPGGKQYEEELTRFNFHTMPTGETKVWVNDELYTWASDQNIWRFYDEPAKKTLVGREKTPKDVMWHLLRTVLYKDFCRTILTNTDTPADKK